jgi:hypothetical protein
MTAGLYRTNLVTERFAAGAPGTYQLTEALAVAAPRS